VYISPANLEKHKLGGLSVTTYDFRTAMKRVGPSVRRQSKTVEQTCQFLDMFAVLCLGNYQFPDSQLTELTGGM
jgi:hypothetical protein